MRSSVSYEKDMQALAKSRGEGLYTIDVKKPGKSGSRVTIQGPASAADIKRLQSFIRRFLARNAGKKPATGKA